MHRLTLLLISTLASIVSSHGILLTPPPRAPGEKSLSSCGEEITSLLRSDNQTSLNALQIASATSSTFDAKKCNLNFCKGLRLEDNEDGVQQWSPGQVVEMTVWTRIPHVGWMSVAIVEEKSGMLVGGQLGSWETGSVSGYADEMEEHKHEEENGVREEISIDLKFEVTIPKIYPRCSVAGECVLQWTWFGRVVKQTYESCVDFLIASEPFVNEKDGLDAGKGSQKKIAERFLA
ncbi:hypothetical protein N431DRAFT_477906 [Stipitochalara longipes BDJ]|nr:hypothetical protein N431DRAFT_477906 [Stipitochalara longipes BDJ]